MSEQKLSQVTALLARGPDQPNGDTRCGIVLEVCLTPQGNLDPAACSKEPWRVRRFWRDRPEWRGALLRLDDGKWGMQAASNPDEPLRELDGQVFRPGEYLMLRRPNGEELVFRIVSVEPASHLAAC